MLEQSIARIDIGNVDERKVPEVGELGEGGLLQGRDLVVMKLRHIVIREWIAQLLAYLEARVELEHLEELKAKKKNKNKNFQSDERCSKTISGFWVQGPFGIFLRNLLVWVFRIRRGRGMNFWGSKV